MDVCLLWVLRVLSGRGLCDELITRPEESYRLWCVVVCDLETSWMRRLWTTRSCRAKEKCGRIWSVNTSHNCIYSTNHYIYRLICELKENCGEIKSVGMTTKQSKYRWWSGKRLRKTAFICFINTAITVYMKPWRSKAINKPPCTICSFVSDLQNVDWVVYGNHAIHKWEPE